MTLPEIALWIYAGGAVGFLAWAVDYGEITGRRMTLNDHVVAVVAALLWPLLIIGVATTRAFDWIEERNND